MSEQSGSGLGKTLMPVPEGHPDVFERSWPLRVADIDRTGRLRFDAACRHIQDIGSDHLRELGYEATHPLWIVRRTMIDLIAPIDFTDTLRVRRWCSGTSTRWCEMRVRIDGRKGGRMESEAFWLNINRETQGPARISDDFLAGLRRTTDVDRLRWKSYLSAGAREDAVEIRRYPVRVSDIDLFDHMNNSVYWSVVEDHLYRHPSCWSGRCGWSSSTTRRWRWATIWRFSPMCTSPVPPIGSATGSVIALLKRSHMPSEPTSRRSPPCFRFNSTFVRYFSGLTCADLVTNQ